MAEKIIIAERDIRGSRVVFHVCLEMFLVRNRRFWE